MVVKGGLGLVFDESCELLSQKSYILWAKKFLEKYRFNSYCCNF